MNSLNPTKQTTIRKVVPIGVLSMLASIIAPLVHAQSVAVTPAVQGDVILAFRNTADSATGSYLVNAGPASQFLSAAPGSTTALSLVGSLGQDLDAYDTTVNDVAVPWHTRKQVVWSAFGRNFSDNEAVYISRPRTSIVQQSAPWGARNGYQQNIAFSEISSVIGQGYNVLTSTVNVADSAGNARGGFQTLPITGATSYYAQVSTAGQQDFRTWPNIEKDFGTGAAASALDFYVHRKGPALSDLGTVTYLGYFSISQAGVVSFTVPAANPLLDTDGDGITDADEALAGTDPQDGTSFFALPAPAIVPGVSTSFALQTIASRKYTIEYNETLSGTWQEVHVHLSGAGALPVNFVDTDPVRIGKQKGFYRASVALP